MSRRALFEGLVSTPEGHAVGVAYVGDQAQYLVPDGGFEFRIDAEPVDREVLRVFGEQIDANREAVTTGALSMLGQDDLFTKAMVDASLKNLGASFDQLLENGLPEGARQYLGLLGLRVILNYHGEVVRVEQAGQIDPNDEGE